VAGSRRIYLTRGAATELKEQRMSKRSCGYESDAMLVRRAHHIVSELPEDDDQARRVIDIVIQLLDFHKEAMNAPGVSTNEEIGPIRVGRGLRALALGGLAVFVNKVGEIARQAGLDAVI
jgi:hypothetical protein